MAKEKHDREDLLNEATGYVRRIEFAIPNHDENVFCGFRECGAVSIYWTQGDVLQFNKSNELRRVFWKDRMIASYKHVLHWLEKSDGRVRLQRTPFTKNDVDNFFVDATSWLEKIQAALEASDTIDVVGQVPNDHNVLADVREWLSQRSWLAVDSTILLALHPGVGR